jgi:phenylacetate-CoA ligase
MRLPDYQVLDPSLERLPRADLQALQGERLAAMVDYVFESSPFWRAKLEAAGVSPGSVQGIEDISRLPFATRAELEEDQAANPPFGSYVCSGPTQWTKLFTTSGTTGRPLRRVYSQRDWGYVMDRFRRSPRIRPGESVMILGPIDGLQAPTAAMESHALMGGLVILAGLWSTRAKLVAIEELRPAIVSGTASYLVHLSEVARKVGIDLRRMGIRQVASAGESGGAVEATRALLSERYGAQVADGYGLTELFPLAGSCPHSASLHVAEDLVLIECVDPSTGEPVAPGDLGELVYTNLVGDTQPLLRYRSRDLGRLSDRSPCACGRTFVRIEGSVAGRVDDMIVYHGVNVFPQAVENVVRTFRELGSEYRIVVSDEDGSLPKLRVEVEVAEEEHARATRGLKERIESELHERLRVRADVVLVPAGALVEVEAGRKVRRVIDLRQDTQGGLQR